MALPSVSYTFTNGTTASASQVNQNFTDLINGITDGSKSLSIDALTTAGAVTFATTATITGNTTVGGTFGVTGNFSVNTTSFTVAASSGNTVVGGTLGLTGDFAINTNKFQVTASSGNTSVAGTLAVTGTTTAAAINASGLITVTNATNNQRLKLVSAVNDSGTSLSLESFGSVATAYGMILAGEQALYATGNLNFMSDNGSGIMRWAVGGSTEAMRLTTTGLGIGMTAVKKLDVNGAIRAAGVIESTTTGFTFPDSTVQASASGNIFLRAYLTGNQTISTTSVTQLQLNTESFDTASAFDTGTYTFTVPAGQGGKYRLHAQVQFGSVTGDPALIDIQIKKNGTAISESALTVKVGGDSMVAVTDVQALVATDAITVAVASTDSSYIIAAGSSVTYLTIERVGP